ncbi:GAF domain-containing protein [Desulfonema ishimotonii]|uniref:GAF domain-containing protein n=1 Tax=Desulfonema ishimotonii TaxID=45657 RepID=A0A401G2Z0_9BACT|nr:GAF domain-containing protein [Desulfonema ishimotonii]GBC63600.1 GAF domain-containing protein [Desulfonema ishimotonii]
MTVEKDYFKTFCKISKAFGTTLNREELLDLIVQSAIDTMDGKAACLFLEDRNRDVFVPVCQKGLSENYLHADAYRGKKMVGEMLKDGYLAFEDVATDSRVENRDLKKAEGIASLLVVPVVADGRPIGVLSLYTATVTEFSRNDIDFLTALAEQGGVAIQTARLIERMKNNALLFHDMSDSINATNLDIRKILHILTADISESFGMKGANIHLLNKDTGTLDLVATYGLSEEFLNKGPVEKDRSVVRALEGETVVIRDARSDERVQYPEAMKKEGIISMLCMSVHSGEEVIGVMRLCSDTERDFPEDMVILVEALAHQGGIAIQNASMYLSLQEDKKNLEQDIWSHRLWF